MNEIQEILNAVQDDGISNERLQEIREIHQMLGKVLDSAQSKNGLSGDVFRAAKAFIEARKV